MKEIQLDFILKVDQFIQTPIYVELLVSICYKLFDFKGVHSVRVYCRAVSTDEELEITAKA